MRRQVVREVEIHRAEPAPCARDIRERIVHADGSLVGIEVAEGLHKQLLRAGEVALVNPHGRNENRGLHWAMEGP